MNDRYSAIRGRVLAVAETDENIMAVVAIGSSTRTRFVADEYSDLDLIIVTYDTESWLYGSIPDQLGDMKISFVEPTLGGGTERRVMYENALDVDMIVFTPAQFETVVRDGTAGWVCNRGYSVLYDAMDFKSLMADFVSCGIRRPDMTKDEYINTVNDFSFHTVWASKKLLRGEMWSAKMCIDAYLKNHLLRMAEMYCSLKYNADVWHDGRFLDTWADGEIRNSLCGCFAHYDKDEMISALFETQKLFTRLARSVAEMKGYECPNAALDYSGDLLSEWFDRK